MPDTPPSDEILPSIPCSRNLRRRTGVWLGVEAWELFTIALLSILPDIAYRIGLTEKANLWVGVIISGIALGFVILFKRDKPPHYFALWIHHHLVHPDGWRAPRSCPPKTPPILDNGEPIP